MMGASTHPTVFDKTKGCRMSPKVISIAGRVLVILVGAVLIFAGSGKAFGFAPENVVKSLEAANILEWKEIIGWGAMITGLLLIIPQTTYFGILSASAYWGGAILTHMTQNEAFIPPAVLLVMTWAGAILLEARRSDKSGPTS